MDGNFKLGAKRERAPSTTLDPYMCVLASIFYASSSAFYRFSYDISCQYGAKIELSLAEHEKCKTNTGLSTVSSSTAIVDEPLSDEDDEFPGLEPVPSSDSDDDSEVEDQ